MKYAPFSLTMQIGEIVKPCYGLIRVDIKGEEQEASIKIASELFNLAMLVSSLTGPGKAELTPEFKDENRPNLQPFSDSQYQELVNLADRLR